MLLPTVAVMLLLPAAPDRVADDAVAAWREPIVIDTYLPDAPDLFPAFLDARVYQGSSGKVYPLPFHERVSRESVPHEWDAVHLENELLRIMILPQLGGRIHVAYDKVAEYDIFYRNSVIKPALVGLAGPWISGGVEFNWPQHHRPATFLPTDVEIEREPDGSVTVWCSDHDPFARMKGMHGIRIRPGSALIECRVRLYNRSELPQTFLWWANVAAAVGDRYQSVFPTDVTIVADHARRDTTTFPRAGTYYGVDYAARGPEADRLDWYRNITVPTSYMVLGTGDEFFGGYDHGRESGFVHWASRDVSPGKKQWTWGNAPFGWTWDRNLTDDDGPYVELMAGVFTDNQPDFAWIAPGETKTFSQYWYPVQKIGAPRQATLRAAASLDSDRFGIVVPSTVSARILVTDAAGRVAVDDVVELRPGSPYLAAHDAGDGAILTVVSEGVELVRVAPRPERRETRSSAVEAPSPAEITTVDELFLVGAYLHQYRHATRAPEPYWQEALTRDPGHVDSRTALGAKAYAAGRFEDAVGHLQIAVDRVTRWTPTPLRGEPLYRLGLALLRLGRDDEAEPVLARSAWDRAWSAPAGWALARLSARRGAWEDALRHLDDTLAAEPQHSQAACLKVLALRRLGRPDGVTDLLERDPLDQWARDLAGQSLTGDPPTLLDVALEYAGVGLRDDALRVLELAAAATAAPGQVEVAPLVSFHRSVLTGEPPLIGSTKYCLPSRLDDIAALEASAAHPVARALLGHWYYDRGRADDAIAAWETAIRAGLDDPVQLVIAHRNLGVAYYNWRRDPEAAKASYERAITAAPGDARLRFELDQLLARSGATAAERLTRLHDQPELIAQRDDLAVETAKLLVALGRASEALSLLAGREFQPWEGGEGQVLGAWEAASIAIARSALADGDASRAVAVIERAITPPESLGEARHPLAATALLHLALGDALDTANSRDRAIVAWRAAARADGDFSGMRPRAVSPQSVFSAIALERLGEGEQASAIRARLSDEADLVEAAPAGIDFFATSLPTMLLFIDPPETARDQEVAALRAAARQRDWR